MFARGRVNDHYSWVKGKQKTRIPKGKPSTFLGGVACCRSNRKRNLEWFDDDGWVDGLMDDALIKDQGVGLMAEAEAYEKERTKHETICRLLSFCVK